MNKEFIKQNYSINNIKKRLSTYTQNNIQEFDKFTHEELLRKILNIESKMVKIKPYKIFESDKVKEKIKKLDSFYQKSYKTIIEYLQIGNNINPFLSKEILYGSKYDMMLLDWNIKHLHINDKKIDNYFNERSDYLLIFFVKDNGIYFIDIVKHKDNNVFFNSKYLLTIHNNWEFLLKPYFTGRYSDNKITDISTINEIQKSRKTNINPTFTINGKSYMIFENGISGAGTNFDIEYKIKNILSIFKDDECKN